MKIVTVPTPGELALDGAAVLADAVVTKADIDDNKLIFTPVAGATGDPYTTFTFKVNDGTDDKRQRLHDDHRRDVEPGHHHRGGPADGDGQDRLDSLHPEPRGATRRPS